MAHTHCDTEFDSQAPQPVQATRRKQILDAAVITLLVVVILIAIVEFISRPRRH